MVLKAKSSSGLPVTYQILAGGGEIEDNKFRPKANGQVWLRAIQKGDSRYYSANPVDVKFEVTAP